MNGSSYGPYSGTVVDVPSIDTVKVSIDLGFDIKFYTCVHIFGINAPELSTPAGKAALTFAKSLLRPGTRIRVVSKGWDKLGGYIKGVITFPGGDFAGQMIAAGHAKPCNGRSDRPV